MRETMRARFLTVAIATALFASRGSAQTGEPPSAAQMAGIVDAVHAFRVHRDVVAPGIDACTLGHLAKADVGAMLKGAARSALVGTWSPRCLLESRAPVRRELLEFRSVVVVADSALLPEARGPVFEVVVRTLRHRGDYGEVFRLREFALGPGEPPRWQVFRYMWVYSLGNDRLGP